MSLDNIQWLAERERWAWLAEENGAVVMNDQARAWLADDGGTFDELAARLTGLSLNAVAAAGNRTELAGFDGRRARWFSTAGGRMVVVAPAPPQASSSSSASKARTDLDGDLARAVGHELGNALGALVGWIGMLREAPETFTAQTLSRLERAATTARRAARDLLGHDDESEAEVEEVLQDVARLLEPAARERGNRLVIEAAGARGPVDLRRGEVFRILWNLALNAIQIVDGGTVTLTATTRRGRLLLTVEDDGPGMSSEVRARIFEPGFGERPGGSGLGLALVARTVRRLRGTVSVRSELGQGTTFEIRLPAPPRTSDVLPRVGHPHRVLVIEDDPGIRELIGTTLDLRDVEAVVVDTVAAARVAVDGAAEPFDLAVADLTLPDGRGDDLLAELKAAGRVRRTLLMSGHAHPGDLAGPPDGWLSKPFDVPELIDAIEGRRLLGVAAS